MTTKNTNHQEKMWAELRAAAELLDVESQQAISGMEAYVSQHRGDAEQLLNELRVEYTYLFINAVPHVPAPPYESCYDGAGRLMNEPVSQVLHLYREAGLTVRDDYDALPDHVSAELEFMFYLIQQGMKTSQSIIEATDIWRKRQNEFLRQHLFKWVPLFLEKVNSNARIPFYRLLAQITESILNTEKNQIQEV